MSNVELLNRLNGCLFVVSSQIGEHPLDNIYYGVLCELDETQILTSYKKASLDPKLNAELREKSDDEKSYSEDEIYSFSDPVKENHSISWLEDILQKNLIGKIKCDRYLIGHIIDSILFIRDDYTIPYIYHCEIEDNLYNGLLVFVPCVDKKYLVITMLSKK